MSCKIVSRFVSYLFCDKNFFIQVKFKCAGKSTNESDFVQYFFVQKILKIFFNFSQYGSIQLYLKKYFFTINVKSLARAGNQEDFFNFNLPCPPSQYFFSFLRVLV